MILRLLLAVLATLLSTAAFAQSNDASLSTPKQEDRCKKHKYKFECEYQAMIEARKAETQETNAQPAPQATQEGYFAFRLDVNEQGSVEKCDVVKSNGPQALADKFCGTFISKAKFKPKLDEHGIAQRDTITQTVKFKIEN